ncbi:hypothetical protein DFH09DRAFT_359992 [Mycena vulgaris]|nr:hypothetical protein DFH09DRAFT_359992 [Mycena vulgaris]
MAPGKPVHSIKIRVPRHNAQKIGAKLSGEVESQARAQDIRTDTYQPNSESAAALNQAIESASEWNSMLITARAERGPQWDMGTQQFALPQSQPLGVLTSRLQRFLVDEYSELYYDSTPLFEAIKKQTDLENAEEAEAAAATATATSAGATGSPRAGTRARTRTRTASPERSTDGHGARPSTVAAATVQRL